MKWFHKIGRHLQRLRPPSTGRNRTTTRTPVGGRGNTTTVRGPVGGSGRATAPPRSDDFIPEFTSSLRAPPPVPGVEAQLDLHNSSAPFPPHRAVRERPGVSLPDTTGPQPLSRAAALIPRRNRCAARETTIRQTRYPSPPPSPVSRSLIGPCRACERTLLRLEQNVSRKNRFPRNSRKPPPGKRGAVFTPLLLYGTTFPYSSSPTSQRTKRLTLRFGFIFASVVLSSLTQG